MHSATIAYISQTLIYNMKYWYLAHTKCRLPLYVNLSLASSDTIIFNPRANGVKRRSGRKPGARVLIPPGYLHPGV